MRGDCALAGSVANRVILVLAEGRGGFPRSLGPLGVLGILPGGRMGT